MSRGTLSALVLCRCGAAILAGVAVGAAIGMALSYVSLTLLDDVEIPW